MALPNNREQREHDKFREDSDGNTVVGVSSASYDVVEDADKVTETNPLSQQFVTEQHTLTNVPNATPDETVIVDMDGFRGFCIHTENTGGTDTFQIRYLASVEGADASDAFLDVTAFGMTSAVNLPGSSYSSDDISHSIPYLTPRAFRLQITTAGGADDADFNVFVKKF